MGVKEEDYFKRQVKVVIVVVLLLGLIFWRTIIFAQKINAILMVFPVSPRCDVLLETYADHIE